MNVNNVKYVRMSEVGSGKLFLADRGGAKILGFGLEVSQGGKSAFFESNPRRVTQYLNVKNSFVLELDCDWHFEFELLSGFSRYSGLKVDQVPLVVGAETIFLPLEIDPDGLPKTEWLIISGENRFCLAEREVSSETNDACTIDQFSLRICFPSGDRLIDPFSLQWI